MQIFFKALIPGNMFISTLCHWWATEDEVRWMKSATSFNKPSSPLRLAIEEYSLLVGTGGWAPQPGGLLLFSCLVMFNSLWPHGRQHTSLPCPSLSPGVCSNSYPSDHPILCCLLLLLPSVFPSIRVYFSESALWIRRPKYWSFSFSISPSNEYSVLISFKS